MNLIIDLRNLKVIIEKTNPNRIVNDLEINDYDSITGI